MLYMLCDLRHFKCVADLLFDGLRALRKGSPNMNSLVGFGSLAAFFISAVGKLVISIWFRFLSSSFFSFFFKIFVLEFIGVVGLTS